MAIYHGTKHKDTRRLAIDEGFGSELDVASGWSIIAHGEGKHVVNGSGLSNIEMGQTCRSVGDGDVFGLGGQNHRRTVKTKVGIVGQS